MSTKKGLGRTNHALAINDSKTFIAKEDLTLDDDRDHHAAAVKVYRRSEIDQSFKYLASIGIENDISSTSQRRGGRMIKKIEFAPTMFGTVLGVLLFNGSLEIWRKREYMTRPDLMFTSEEIFNEFDEEGVENGGGSVREKEDDDDESVFTFVKCARLKSSDSSYTSFSFAPNEHGLVVICGEKDGSLDVYGSTRDARDVKDLTLSEAATHFMESEEFAGNLIYDAPLFEVCNRIESERPGGEVIDLQWRFESPNAATVAVAFKWDDSSFEIKRFVYKHSADRWIEQTNAMYKSSQSVAKMDWSKDGSRIVFVEGGSRAVILDTSGEFSHEDEVARNLGNLEFESDIVSVSFNELGTHLAVTTEGNTTAIVYKESLTRKRMWDPVGQVFSD
jgi:hypothetical protein